MSTLDTIRTAIAAKISGVADIGKVNDYERYTQQMSELKNLFVANIGGQDVLLGWNIRRVSKRTVQVATGRHAVYNTWRIRGYMALDDAAASEKTFDDLIETLCDAFITDDDLGGVLFSSINQQNNESGLQLIDSKPVLFAGVLCHHALLGLTTEHLIT
jgi:hypothetical protein